jgi:hypothetical protein
LRLTASNTPSLREALMAIQPRTVVGGIIFPPVLFISLDQFRTRAFSGEREQSRAPFAIPQNLDLSELACRNWSDEKYTLFSILVCTGASAASSYAACIKPHLEQWYRFTDSSVMPANISEMVGGPRAVFARSAYMLDRPPWQVNRACFRPILCLCTQLLRCDDLEFDLADLLPAAFVRHCVTRYVNAKFHELEYLDFFINFVMISGCCIDVLLENAVLLPFCCEQASEGTVSAQRTVRRLFWALLYVTTVKQMDRFRPSICEFLADSFDDDHTDHFIRDASEAVNKVLVKSEIKSLHGTEIYEQFLSEVVPRVAELTSESYSQEISNRALAGLTCHADIVEPYRE